MANKEFIPLKNLEVYKLAIELSDLGWEIYSELSWQDKKIMGDQFIEASDSVGANVAEGYFRFHFLDKIKFYYFSRASLTESCGHWLELLHKRGKVKKDKYEKMKQIEKKLSVKLNNFITVTYRCKNDKIDN